MTYNRQIHSVVDPRFVDLGSNAGQLMLINFRNEPADILVTSLFLRAIWAHLAAYPQLSKALL